MKWRSGDRKMSFCKLAMLFLVVLLLSSFTLPPTNAQSTETLLALQMQAQLAAQTQLMRKLRIVRDVMIEYGAGHEEFPSTTQEMDECLKIIAANALDSMPDANVQYRNVGQYRGYDQFVIRQSDFQAP